MGEQTSLFCSRWLSTLFLANTSRSLAKYLIILAQSTSCKAVALACFSQRDKICDILLQNDSLKGYILHLQFNLDSIMKVSLSTELTGFVRHEMQAATTPPSVR